MTNTPKLRGKIAEKGYTLSSFSDAMHITRPCMRNKINGVVDFKASEIEKCCVLLSIPFSEVEEYFFARNVPISETTM